MADLTITTIKRVSGNVSTSNAGEALAAGDVVYSNSTGNTHDKADATDTTKASAIGVQLLATDSGALSTVAQSGSVIEITGTTLTVGDVYVVSATSGKIAPQADLTTGDILTIIGYAKTTSQIQISITPTGVVIA